MSIELAPDDDYEAEPVNLVPLRTVHNASTRESYVSEISKVPARGEGAMHAYRIPRRTGFNADLTSDCVVRASTAGEA